MKIFYANMLEEDYLVRKRVRVFSLILVLLLSLSTLGVGGSITVYADAASAQSSLGVSNETVAEYLAVWNAFIADGLTPQAAAGIMGNLYCESSFRGSASETGGTAAGIGIAQWSTNANRTALQDWSKKCGHPTTEIKGYKICTDAACQGAFLLTQLQNDWSGNIVSKYNTYAQDYSNRGVPQNITPYTSFSSFKSATDVTSAAISMFDCYERGAGVNILLGKAAKAYTSGKSNDQWFVDEHKNRPEKAALCYTLFTGTDIAPSSSASSTLASSLYSAGYWTEEDLAVYARLIEIDVDSILAGATRENLSQDNLYGVAMWERNIKYDAEESGFINILRRAIMILGIILIIWVMLIYCAYWFDRVNNFYYLDLLGILTFGHLHMSDTESECTFRVKNLGKDEHKTVNHRAILFICLTGIAFGVLIITGVFYSFLQRIIYFILRRIGSV